MLLVLTCAVLLLIVVPGLLFWLGRLIQANTDARFAARRSAGVQGLPGSSTGDVVASWVRRPMRPAFGRIVPMIADDSAPPVAVATSWVQRPMRPAFSSNARRQIRMAK